MIVPWDLVVYSIALALVAPLATISGVRNLRLSTLQANKSDQAFHLYEDEDGVATEESQRAYSVKVQNVLASTIAIVGFGVSLAGTIRATVAGSNVISWWLHCSLWVLYMNHALQVFC